MPQTPARLFVLLALLVFSFACGGDDDPTNPSGGNPSGGQGPVTATIDGTGYVAAFANVSSAAGQTYVNAAGSSPVWAVGFTFPSAAGTYTFGVGQPVSGAVTLGSASWVGGNTNGSGTIVVTAFEDHRVAGTFDFVAIGTNPTELSVTNGQFDITF
ncbi:MAG: hypothetical protein R3E97_20910 [Candidatus Eisenbacteria bacterium]